MLADENVVEQNETSQESDASSVDVIPSSQPEPRQPPVRRLLRAPSLSPVKEVRLGQRQSEEDHETAESEASKSEEDHEAAKSEDDHETAKSEDDDEPEPEVGLGMLACTLDLVDELNDSRLVTESDEEEEETNNEEKEEPIRYEMSDSDDEELPTYNEENDDDRLSFDLDGDHLQDIPNDENVQSDASKPNASDHHIPQEIKEPNESINENPVENVPEENTNQSEEPKSEILPENPNEIGEADKTNNQPNETKESEPKTLAEEDIQETSTPKISRRKSSKQITSNEVEKAKNVEVVSNVKSVQTTKRSQKKKSDTEADSKEIIGEETSGRRRSSRTKRPSSRLSDLSSPPKIKRLARKSNDETIQKVKKDPNVPNVSVVKITVTRKSNDDAIQKVKSPNVPNVSVVKETVARKARKSNDETIKKVQNPNVPNVTVAKEMEVNDEASGSSGLRRSSRTRRPSIKTKDLSSLPKTSAKLARKSDKIEPELQLGQERVLKKSNENKQNQPIKIPILSKKSEATNQEKPPRKSTSRSSRASSTIREDQNAENLAKSRRRTNLKPVVMFTGYESATDSKIVQELGGTITDKVAECSVLITTKLRRTTKLMCGLGRGIPIVSPQWLTQSKITKTFLGKDISTLSKLLVTLRVCSSN